MPLQPLDVICRSATATAPLHQRQTAELAKLIDISKCIGCKACQVACMEWNGLCDEIGVNSGVLDNPSDLSAATWTVMRYSGVEREPGTLEWLIRKDGCMHCTEPGCLKVCPAPGAIVQYSNGIVDFQDENCIGCGYCVTGCPFNIPRLSRKNGKAYKCTLCSDRVAVGMEPACVKSCPTGALVFGTKEDMKRHAEGRIADLKERDYPTAGLYDPPGVRGTHVMYVLKHADEPELYSGLPKDPSEGISKPLTRLGTGFTVLAGFFHCIAAGLDETLKQDAERLGIGSAAEGKS